MIFLIILHLLITIGLISIILMQKGESGGALMGSSQGSGLFTAKGSANIMTHITAVLATLFFLNCIFMVFISTGKMKESQKTIQQIEVQRKK
ncbi:MAG: preprotein translocase subunit SecG [Alphaproteobacteria bacterium]|nr:MAG: preprotein translocase subunit SecG [Alphaproteobacteria bacterium]